MGLMPKMCTANLATRKILDHLKSSKTCFRVHITGKYLSEALVFASTNPQYDDRLFIELQVQYMKIPSSEHGENIFCKKKGF